MKNAVRLFFLVLTVGLIFVLTGCKKPDPTPEPEPTPEITDFNVLGNWTDGGDGVYTFNTNTTTELDFTYDKATFPYAYMQSPLITQDLSVYKKLIITVEGTGTMLLKLETDDDSPAKEVGLNVTGIQGTYEWNLLGASDFLAKVDRIVIIAAPGKEESVGAITISELTFKEAVADNYIIEDGYTNIPTNVNEYNGTDEIFNFNSKWESNDAGVYEITYDDTDAVVEYDKGAGLEWAFMKTRVQGDFTDFNYAVFIVTGTSGHKLLIKPNEYNAVESFIWLDGTAEQELVIDLTDLTLEQKNAIIDFKVFIAAGLAPASGELTIHEAFMTEDYEFEEPVILVNEYNGTDASFALEHYYDGGDLVYDLTQTGTDLVVDYEKASSSLNYAFMYANLEGDFSGFTKIEFEMTGQSGKSILLKVESPVGNKEEQKSFDGTKQVFTLDLTTMTTAQLEQLSKLVLFAAPGTGTASGQFTIHSITFKTSDYEVDTDWTSLVDGVYTFTPGETLVVNYNKPADQPWAGILNTLDAEAVAGLNTLTVVLKGTAGKSVLVKPNDNSALEQTIAFTDANPVTKVFTAQAFTSIVMFGEPNTPSVTGSFEIVSIKLSYVPAELDMTKIFDFNADWTKDPNKETYTFDFQDDKTVATYNKVAGGEWDWMKTVFDQKEVNGLNTLTLVLKGTAGKQVLVKPNDSGALEKFVTFTDAEPVTVVVYAEAFASVFLFGEPNVTPTTGSFEILTATLSYTKDIQSTWVENDAGTYTVTPNGSMVDVAYTKIAEQEYVFLKANFTPASVEGLNTITIVLKGTAGKSVLVKANNSVEQTATFVDAETPVTITMTLPEVTGLILFAEGGTAPATGTFQIVSAKIYYVEPVVDFDPTAVVDVNTDWVENDADTYDFTVEDDGSVTVSYDHAGWAFMKQTLDQEVVAGLNTLTIVLEGTEGKKILVKPNDAGALEQWITFGSEPFTFVAYNEAGFTNILIFAEPESNPATGTFTIVSAVLSYQADVNSNWVENDTDTYNFTVETDGSVTVAYGHGGWAFMKQTLDQEVVAGLNTLTIVLEGTEGKKILVKPNDAGALEQWITFGTEPFTFVSYNPAGFTNILIFAEPESSPAAGTFSIISAKLSYVAPEDDFDPTLIFDFNGDWVKDAGKDVYIFDFQAEKTVVNYVKGTGGEWDWAKANFDAAEVAGLNTLTMVIQGTEGKQVLVKPNDAGSLEQWITFGAAPITIVVRAEAFTSVVIFGEPNVASVSGSFEILSAELSYTVSIGDAGWVANDVGAYTILDGVVTYTKIAGQDYSAFINNFDLEAVAGLNTLTVVLKGTAGKSVILKPNDAGALEQTVTFTDANEVVKVFTAEAFTKMVFMAEGGTAPATGTFEIVSIILSYVPEE